MKTLYWDCFSGIAGNMAVASLIDLGASRETLIKGIESIPFEEGSVELIIEEKLVKGIRGTYFNTADDHPKHNHHDCHSHHAPHRGLNDIKKLIEKAAISCEARKVATDCFEILAEAEAKIHGTSVDKIHFHEVGARDSIADIVGAAICIDSLKISRIISSPVNLGSGTVKCAHGMIPVPAPATALILEGAPVVFDHEIKTELTTPTGAAILRGLNCEFSHKQSMSYHKVGHGHGSKDIGRPNFLRAFLQDNSSEDTPEIISMLETNLDNVSGEMLGHAMDSLMNLGALDVCVVPIIMKKGRPAQQLQILTRVEDCDLFMKTVFELLPTTGIRHGTLHRRVLGRNKTFSDSLFGKVDCKEVHNSDQTVSRRIEFEEITRIAREQKCTPLQIFEKIYKIRS